MKIYTKTGDLGETGVIAGKRISKSELIIEANGALDEASSYIGWAREQIEDDRIRMFMSGLQHDLYQIMGYLAGADIDLAVFERKITAFEKEMDQMAAKLPALNRFILPQGSEATTRLHIARTIIRSAERRVVRYIKGKPKSPEHVPEKAYHSDLIMIKYLNRLSDLFFTLARTYAQVEKVT
ncbi:MAG: cob(I)yrinic acid a,c-diamide adenosyltransferase [Candidatus Roizmanbacteria bacterium]